MAHVIQLSERYRVKPPEPKDPDERDAEVVIFPVVRVVDHTGADSRDFLPPCDIG